MSATPGSCPAAGTLIAWLDDALGPDERALLAAHLDSCAPCRRGLEELRERRAAVTTWLEAHDTPPPPREAYDLGRRAGPGPGPRTVQGTRRAPGDPGRAAPPSRPGGRARRWSLAASVILAAALVAGPARGWILERLGVPLETESATQRVPAEAATTSFVPIGPEVTLAFTGTVAGRTLELRRGAGHRVTFSSPHPDPELVVGPDRVEIRDGDRPGEYSLAVPASVVRVRVRVPGEPDALLEVGEARQVVRIAAGGPQ